MVKKRKTREQKKLADLRHRFLHKALDYTFDKKPVSSGTEVSSPSVYTASNPNYTYLIHDFTKTFTLTAVIVGAQIFIFILLKMNLINIPGIIY